MSAFTGCVEKNKPSKETGGSPPRGICNQVRTASHHNLLPQVWPNRRYRREGHRQVRRLRRYEFQYRLNPVPSTFVPTVGLEPFWHRCLKPNRIVCIWMKELKSVSVEHHSTVGVGACTVSCIANHGRANVLHGHADLMAASGLDREFH